MRVGDSRWPLRYLSSPLCSILWRLLWLNVFAASPLLVSSLAFSTQKVLMFLSVQLEVSVDCGDHSFLDLVNINPLMGTGNYSAHRIIWSWYTGRWWVGCYIWYNEEGPGGPIKGLKDLHCEEKCQIWNLLQHLNRSVSQSVQSYTVCLKETGPLQLIWHNLTNSQYLLITFGTEKPYSIPSSLSLKVLKLA